MRARIRQARRQERLSTSKLRGLHHLGVGSARSTATRNRSHVSAEELIIDAIVKGDEQAPRKPKQTNGCRSRRSNVWRHRNRAKAAVPGLLRVLNIMGTESLTGKNRGHRCHLLISVGSW
jgi:hypothetical protein